MSVTWEVSGVTKTGPSWPQMVDQAAHILGYETPDLLHLRGTDLQILEYFRIKKSNFAPLTNWMVRLLDAPDEAIRSSKVRAGLGNLHRTIGGVSA
jgi:hypothetical protein